MSEHYWIDLSSHNIRKLGPDKDELENLLHALHDTGETPFVMSPSQRTLRSGGAMAALPVEAHPIPSRLKEKESLCL